MSLNLDDIIDSISDNLVNGNRTDALNQFRTLSPLHSAYVAIAVIEYESITIENKRWLLNALYNG